MSKPGILLGAVADDMIGVPDKKEPVPDADAVVVALKSRSALPVRAVSASLKAQDWLKKAGARQYFFKY